MSPSTSKAFAEAFGDFLFLRYSKQQMANSNIRNDKYRYKVGEGSADVTPMASIEAYLGNRVVPVLNISSGGMALLLPTDIVDSLDVGDPMDASISIRERAFPMQLELKSLDESGRGSCSFLNAPPAFLSALKEFLGPKHLGASITHNKAHTNIAEALELEKGAQSYEAYTGQNQTGIFVWLGENKKLLKLLAVSRHLALGWTPSTGTQTGQINSHDNIQDIKWDRAMEFTVFHYLADILIAWRNETEDEAWIKELFDTPAASEAAEQVIFPY